MLRTLAQHNTIMSNRVLQSYEIVLSMKATAKNLIHKSMVAARTKQLESMKVKNPNLLKLKTILHYCLISC